MKSSRIKLAVAISGLVALTALTATADLTNGLVAYYPFDGSANDASGNGNNGIAYGVVPTADRSGNPNSAYHFDGNAFISIPYPARWTSPQPGLSQFLLG